MEAARQQLVTLLEAIERNFVTGRALRQEGLTDAHIIVVGLLAKAATTFKAARLLLSEGLFEPMQALARLLTEDAVRIVYFAANEERLKEIGLRYKFKTARELLSLGRFAKEQGFAGGDDDMARAQAELDALTSAAQAAGIALTEFPNVREMMEAVGKPERYWYYKRASHSLHTTLVALGSHLEEIAPNEYRVKETPDEKQLLVVGILLADTFMSAVIAASRLLGWDTSEALISFRHFMDTKLQELAKRSGITIPAEVDGPEAAT